VSGAWVSRCLGGPLSLLPIPYSLAPRSSWHIRKVKVPAAMAEIPPAKGAASSDMRAKA